MSLNKEISLEGQFCAGTSGVGYIYGEGSASHYYRALALFPGDMQSWLQATQPQAWHPMSEAHALIRGHSRRRQIAAE